MSDFSYFCITVIAI